MPERIYQLRKSLRLSQTAFGAKIGVTGGGVSLVERGLREPSRTLIAMICKVYGINEAWLLTGEGPMESQQGAQLVTAEVVETVNRLLQVLSRLPADDWAAVRAGVTALLDAAEAGRMDLV